MTEQAPETDVVVVGAGNAALVAAISAHEAGARVLVLEAAPTRSGEATAGSPAASSAARTTAWPTCCRW